MIWQNNARSKNTNDKRGGDRLTEPDIAILANGGTKLLLKPQKLKEEDERGDQGASKREYGQNWQQVI